MKLPPPRDDQSLDDYAKAHRDHPATIGFVHALVMGVMEGLGDRIKAVEDKPGLQYCGAWSETAEYRVGNVVTDRGSAWVAKLNFTKARPGTDAGLSWQLMVKKGRDAR